MTLQKIMAEATDIIISLRKIDHQLQQGKVMEFSSLIEDVHDFQLSIMDILSKNPAFNIRSQLNDLLSEMSSLYTKISSEYEKIKSEMQSKTKNFEAAVAYQSVIIRK